MTDNALFAEMAADVAAAVPTTEQSLSVKAVAEEAARLADWIVRAEKLVKERKARLNQIQMRDLVDAMDAISQDHMGLPEFGVDIVTGDYVHASLPSPGDKDSDEEREAKLTLRRGGLDWLVANEHESLIKTVVTVELPRGAVADAQRIKRMIEELPELGPDGEVLGNGAPIGYSASIVETVHWGTLTSFVKEQLRRPDVSLPLEMLGATVGRIAKIVKRKDK